MSLLLIRDADCVATFDGAQRELRRASVLVRDGLIEDIGPASELPQRADEVIDAPVIALGVALTTQCPYSLELHRQAAIAAGATEAELAETVFMTALMRAGGAVLHGTHLMPES